MINISPTITEFPFKSRHPPPLPQIHTYTHTYHINHNRFWSSCFKHYPKRLGSLYQSTFVCEGEEQGGEWGEGERSRREEQGGDRKSSKKERGRSREGRRRGRGNKDEQKEEGPLFI